MFEFDGVKADADTICALSTPPGHGGIAVLRVSGPRAFAITRALCHFLPAAPESHKIYYGIAHDTGGSPLDEVLVSCFQQGRSFTGEETAEISCHGSPVLAAQILMELVHHGARTARKGEFTCRAFMNGKLDLVQAESVLALVASESKPAARMAMRQLQGELSSDYARIEDGLIWMLAQLEAGIDFSTEGIDVVDNARLRTTCEELIGRCEKLLKSYRQGQVIKSGLVVVLIGEPNVGKSSLLNALVGEERAIVTSEPGTTRDTVEGRISINGVHVTFTDTAGLRITENEIEKIGIEKSHQALRGADVVFHIIDDPDANLSKPKIASEQDYFLILNKSDILPRARHRAGAIAVSAVTGAGLDLLRDQISAITARGVMADGSMVSQVRHVELLKKIHSCLLKALALIIGPSTLEDSIVESSSPEFVAFELQDAIRAVHELLGKEFDEQVIDRIFKEFCIGK